MSDPINDAICEHSHLLDSAVNELDRLAGAAHAIGLDRMADTMDAICESLRASKTQLRAAHGDSVYLRLQESEQATANMMNAIFATASIREASS